MARTASRTASKQSTKEVKTRPTKKFHLPSACPSIIAQEPTRMSTQFLFRVYMSLFQPAQKTRTAGHARIRAQTLLESKVNSCFLRHSFPREIRQAFNQRNDELTSNDDDYRRHFDRTHTKDHDLRDFDRQMFEYVPN